MGSCWQWHGRSGSMERLWEHSFQGHHLIMYTHSVLLSSAPREDRRWCSGQVLALESAQHLGMSWDEDCNRARFRLARYTHYNGLHGILPRVWGEGPWTRNAFIPCHRSLGVAPPAMEVVSVSVSAWEGGSTSVRILPAATATHTTLSATSTATTSCRRV